MLSKVGGRGRRAAAQSDEGAWAAGTIGWRSGCPWARRVAAGRRSPEVAIGLTREGIVTASAAWFDGFPGFGWLLRAARAGPERL